MADLCSRPTARSTGTCSASARAATTSTSSTRRRAPRRAARRVVALTIPQSMRIRLSFLSGFVLDGLPGWREVLGLPVPERHARARRSRRAGPARRAGALRGSGRARGPRALGAVHDRRGVHPRDQGVRRAARSATSRAERGKDAVRRAARHRGRRRAPHRRCAPSCRRRTDATWQARAAVWRDPRAIVGGSDAGAHLDMICMAGYSTFLVGDAVRDLGCSRSRRPCACSPTCPPGSTASPTAAGSTSGAHADLVMLRSRDASGPGGERTLDDLPGGASRIVVDSVGVEHRARRRHRDRRRRRVHRRHTRHRAAPRRLTTPPPTASPARVAMPRPGLWTLGALGVAMRWCERADRGKGAKLWVRIGV